MRRADTLAGVLVLALVAGGVYWVRGPFRAGAGTAAAPAPGPSDHGASGPARPDTTSIPDVTRADGTVQAGEVSITLSVSPRPPVAFQTMRVRVLAASGAAPVVLEDGSVLFEMTMPMGDHRYTLVPGSDGWQHAEVVLPFCASGNPRWYATLEGTAGGRRVNARFRLDLTRP
jgi:hypothetical protein